MSFRQICLESMSTHTRHAESREKELRRHIFFYPKGAEDTLFPQMANYYNIDDILIEEELISVVFKVAANGVGLLDPSLKTNMPGRYCCNVTIVGEGQVFKLCKRLLGR